MVYITEQLHGNALSLGEDGELMHIYCAGGAMYLPAKYVMWDELDATTHAYFENRHKYLLEELMPERLADYYPECDS